MGLHAKWIEGTLTEDDIKQWLKQQGHIKFLLEKEVLDEDNLDHVAMCLHHVFQWYHGKIPLGHFLRAVVENDFMEACGRADSTNKLVLPIYATFLYNYAPIDYRKKAKPKLRIVRAGICQFCENWEYCEEHGIECEALKRLRE